MSKRPTPEAVKLRKLIADSGLTINGWAKLLTIQGVSSRTVRRWLAGTSPIPLQLRAKLKVVATLLFLVLSGCAQDISGPTPSLTKGTAAGVPGTVDVTLCFAGSALSAQMAGLPACPEAP